MKLTNNINLTLGLDNTTQLRMMMEPVEGFAIRVNMDECLSGVLQSVDDDDLEVWTGDIGGLVQVPLGEIYHIHIY